LHKILCNPPLTTQITLPKGEAGGPSFGFRRGQAVTDTPTQTWDRHSILAEIKRRYGSLRAFAETTPLSIKHFSVALGSPYPKAEKYISRALKVPMHQLWPDRYDAKGRRIPNRRKAAKASPERDAA